MEHENIKALYVGFTLFGDNDATGKTLEHIFSYCSRITWLQYCLDTESVYHQTSYDAVYLSSKRSIVYSTLKKIYRKFTGVKSDGSAQVSVCHTKPSIKVVLGKALLDWLPKRVSSKDLEKIDDFKPEVIYTLGENITTLRTALWLSNRYNIPIIRHMMDDFEGQIYNDYKITSHLRKKYLSLQDQAFAKSRIHMAIGEKMAKEMERRHHCKFEHAMNCIDELHPQPLPENNPLRFVFSGGLHGGRADVLAQIGNLIKNTPEFKNSAELVVFTSKGNMKQYGHILKDNVKLLEYVPQEEIFKNLGKADVLVHVESFEPAEIEFFKYSMSTKIPEYLSVGRPILCYGPSEICTVSYIDAKKVGLVVDSEEDLREAISRLVLDSDLRKEIGDNALRVAENEHLAEIVAQCIEKIFAESVL